MGAKAVRSRVEPRPPAPALAEGRASLCGLPVAGVGALWPGLPEAAGEPRVRFCRIDAVPERLRGRELFDGPGFRIAEVGSRLELALRDREAPAARAFAAIDPGAFTVRVASAGDPASRRLVDQLVPELAVAHLWPLHGAAYLHAAGTLGPAGVRLFLGRSGAGKSTAAAALERAGDAPFCADRAAVAAGWAAGAPWHGGRPDAGRPAPLTALFALDRQGPWGVDRLSPPRALAALAANAFLPRWWPEGLGRALDLLGVLAESVPVFRLAAPPDGRLAALVGAACERSAG